MDQVLGGWSETKVATAEIQKICVQVKEQVEKKTGKKYEEFRIVEYKEQIVTEVKYIMKVHVGGDNHLHVFVSPPEGKNEGIKVCCIQGDKTKDDPIEPFKC